MKKNICIVTGSRAEYGLFYPLLKLLHKTADFNLQIIATGTHLSKEFGLTYREILKDGFTIDRKVNIGLIADNPSGILDSMGLALSGLGRAYAQIKPGLVVLLGDRFETFCAATAAHVSGIPIAHLHGGELTEGAMDDAFRHAITKMSLLHFTSTQEYRRRVIQLGESPDHVFDVGALGVDNALSLKLKTRTALEKELNFSFGKRTAMVTFHPVTLDQESPAGQLKELLNALDKFSDLKVIFTLPNADPGSREITRAIQAYVGSNPDKARTFVSLGRLNYLSVLDQVDVVAGNSSSGIIEAPSLGKPTVNIGLRQKGRVMAKSIINCNPREKDIVKALKKSFSPGFVKLCRKVRNPYGEGKAAEQIVKIIAANIKGIKNTRKTFRDIKYV